MRCISHRQQEQQTDSKFCFALDFRNGNPYLKGMKHNRITAFFAALICIAAVNPTATRAQLIFPEVHVDTQNLPEEAQTKLAGLDSVLSLFLSDESQEWNRDEGGYDLPLQINIFFTEYSPNPQEDKFKANLIITNRQESRFDDKRWEFGLRQPFQFQRGTYHPFTGVLEFYVWTLIGLEEDKFVKLGGRKYFDKARQVFLQSTSSLYYFGWDKRDELLRNYVDDNNAVFRELNFFYYTGLYYNSLQQFAKAKDYLFYALVKLEKLPIDVQQQFLESNHRQFAEALKLAGYDKGVRALIRLDPAHTAVYETIAPKEGNGD